MEALQQEPPGTRSGEQRLENLLHALDLVCDIARTEEIEILFGEVENGLDEHSQVNELIAAHADLAREFADQAPRGGANARRCRGADEVGDSLGLGEVDLVVQKGALGELAGLGKTRAQIEAASQDQREHSRAAMPLQLQDVFTGV